MIRRAVLVAALVLFLGSGPSTAGPAAPTPAAGCASSCRAAYDAIAKALPRDRENVLLSALLHTPGVDWRLLARSLHVPTARQIHAEWRRQCELRFPGDAVDAALCYRLIFGP
jgi:hypothetical protein